MRLASEDVNHEAKSYLMRKNYEDVTHGVQSRGDESYS